MVISYFRIRIRKKNLEEERSRRLKSDSGHLWHATHNYSCFQSFGVSIMTQRSCFNQIIGEQVWIGFNFCGSGLDSDWKISQSAHLWSIV